MLNLNKLIKTKPKPKPKLVFKNCSCVCVYHCVQLSYTVTQHRTVLMVFPLILQTIIRAQVMSTRGEGHLWSQVTCLFTTICRSTRCTTGEQRRWVMSRYSWGITFTARRYATSAVYATDIDVHLSRSCIVSRRLNRSSLWDDVWVTSYRDDGSRTRLDDPDAAVTWRRGKQAAVAVPRETENEVTVHADDVYGLRRLDVPHDALQRTYNDHQYQSINQSIYLSINHFHKVKRQ